LNRSVARHNGSQRKKNRNKKQINRFEGLAPIALQVALTLWNMLGETRNCFAQNRFAYVM
jgi:hypothetical protein